MGDTTQACLTIDGGSDNVRSRLVGIYTEYAYPSFGGTDDALDEWFEIRSGSCEEIRDEMRKYLRNVRTADKPTYLSLVEDGVYEWTGDLFRFRPGIGWHHVEIDNGGNVIVNSRTLLTMIDAAADLETLRKRVEKVVGTKWDLTDEEKVRLGMVQPTWPNTSEETA